MCRERGGSVVKRARDRSETRHLREFPPVQIHCGVPFLSTYNKCFIGYNMSQPIKSTLQVKSSRIPFRPGISLAVIQPLIS